MKCIIVSVNILCLDGFTELWQVNTSVFSILSQVIGCLEPKEYTLYTQNIELT